MAYYEMRDFKSYAEKQNYKNSLVKTWTFKDFMKNDPKALQRMKDKEPKLFSELFKNEYGVFPKL